MFFYSINYAMIKVLSAPSQHFSISYIIFSEHFCEIQICLFILGTHMSITSEMRLWLKDVFWRWSKHDLIMGFLEPYTKVFLWGFPGSSNGKESACNAGDLCSFPGLGRSPGEGNSNPPQNSCLKNPMDRGGWWVTVHGVGKGQTQLTFNFTFFF